VRVIWTAIVGVWLLTTASLAGQSSVVEPQSLMTTPVYLLKGTQEVSQGTGFFFANMKPDRPTEAETVFLVTNYHVVTGHAPGSRAPRNGDHIRFALHASIEDLENTRAFDLPLYDQQGQPVWAASESSPNADVVLIPLPPRVYAGIPLYVFTEEHTRVDIKIRPTSGATLLGYPFGFFDTKHLLPIWKTGHIASEPDVDFEGEPTFLVDVSAFPGMSGSPVLAVSTGVYETEEGSMRSGRVLRLLGVFSSMPVVIQNRADVLGATSESGGAIETSLQLGYVWKSSVVADIAKRYRTKAP
jgi:hypothetical protein